jgi:hypothetical protein
MVRMHEYPLALCTVMLLELVVPAGQPPEDPVVLKKLVHELVAKALRGLPENTRIAVESAGAATICFIGDPEEALHSALLLRDLMAQRYRNLMTVKIALNLGPARVKTDLNDMVHVTGPGIQDASQVKKLAQPNEVLVSDSYHALLSRLNPDTADLFQYHGVSEKRPLETYSVIPALRGPGGAAVATFTQTHPVPLSQGRSLDPEVVQDVEAELAGYIGPLARVLVRKAERRAADPRELREMLAPAILNPQTREFFVVGKLGQQQDGSAQQAAPPEPGRSSLPNKDATRQVDIAPAELAIIEHTLHRFIGPMAHPLMLREIDFCLQFGDFVHSIAGSISHPQQREVFLQALQRALPERHIQ